MPEVLDGQGFIREVRPYRTSRFQSRIISDVANSVRMSAGAMLLRTGSQSVLVHRRPYCTSDGPHGVI